MTKIIKSVSSNLSYVSNYSDQTSNYCGFRKTPGEIIQDTESLWDFREPITLRLHKLKTNELDTLHGEFLSNNQLNQDVKQDDAPKKEIDESIPVKQRFINTILTVDKSQQTDITYSRCITNLRVSINTNICELF